MPWARDLSTEFLTAAAAGAKLARPRTPSHDQHAGIVMRRTPKAVAGLLGLAVWCGAAGLAAAGTIKGTVRLAGGSVEVKKLKVTVDHNVVRHRQGCGRYRRVARHGAAQRRGVVGDAPTGCEVERGADRPVGPEAVCIRSSRGRGAGRRHRGVPEQRPAPPQSPQRQRRKNNPTFNRTQPKGRAIPITFRRPEIIRIDCDLHPWMRAWVVVAEHPFYALTNDKGEFALENVPPGTYTLRVWHETLPS